MTNPKWDWSKPELRARVKPGTLLETWDCAKLTVVEVHEDGVVVTYSLRLVEASDPQLKPYEGEVIAFERFQTWEEMTRGECMITGEVPWPPEGPEPVEIQWPGRLGGPVDPESSSGSRA